MKLNLKRPIVFFDLETTGLNIASDRIVEISMLKIGLKAEEHWFTSRVNPGIPISPASTAVHGIRDADVADSPTFKELASNVVAFMEGCDLAGYNAVKFDIPILAEELLRVNVDFDFKKRRYVDVQVIFHKKEQRTLSAAYQFYCGRDQQNQHSAQSDTSATYEVLQSQLDRYNDLENDIEKLSKYTTTGTNVDFAGRIVLNDKGVEIFNFGKYKGLSVTQVLDRDPSYFSWIMNGDFPLYTKKVLTEIKLRSFGKA